ncbi:MAG: TlpA disulfide reductase family protein [Planctomycetota bacterium]
MTRTATAALAMVLAAGGVSGTAAAQSAAEIVAQERASLDAPAAAPTLMPGDEAPALAVKHWVKGAPISEFEEGTAYLVDFWATWCGPCIASIPKLTELQSKYAGDNFTLLAVSVWERPTGDALIEHVTRFVDKRGDQMGYTIAIDDGRTMAESWIEAAGQQGIPTAMIVDRSGKIAWIGYGTDPVMGDVLDQVVNDEWDVVEARETREKSMLEALWYERINELQSSDRDRAVDVTRALYAEGAFVTPGLMNAIAWSMVEDDSWDAGAHTVARDLAQSAIDTGGDDASILDTLAWAHYRLGDVERAVEVQTKAVSLADSRMRAALEASLETFKSGG